METPLDRSSKDSRSRSRSWSWLGEHLSALLLSATSLGLVVGAAAHVADLPTLGNAAWAVCGSIGALYSLWTMLDGIRHRRLGVDVIALLAEVGALLVGEYLAAAVIAVMLASGRALEDWANGRATRDLRLLVERAPTTAHRYRDQDGRTAMETVSANLIAAGDRLMVANGELVPTDGILLADAVLDESTLTGESLPVHRSSGEPVRSGLANAGAPFDLRATAPASDSAYAGIVRLVAQAEASRAPFVRLADRYAIAFLGLTLVVAAGAWVAGGATRAVAVLVVATPCPLILAAPIALVGGLSRSARRGVVIKGAGVLERLARCSTLLIDKTGTLTRGRPTVSSIVPMATASPEEVLTLAASLDQASQHVVARALVEAAQERGCTLTTPTNVEEVAGSGIRGLVGERSVALGNARWLGLTESPPWAKSAERRARLDGSLTVFVGVDQHPAGVVVLDDPVRPDAARTIHSLRSNGIDRIVMVTGDRQEVADAIGSVIGVDEVFAERTPADKLDAVRAEQSRSGTIMVGDGVNDAPALALADVGVAMGSTGATASTETADVVLTIDRLDRLGEAHSLARRSRRIALQSVIAGMGMSLVAMGFAAVGLLPAVWGAILQEGIDVVVILNALRSVRPVDRGPQLGPDDSLVAKRFEGEHVMIRSDLERLLAVADSIGTMPPPEVMPAVREVCRLLTSEVLPHEKAEQDLLYPALDRALGGEEPTGPMTRSHLEIAHRVRRLVQLADDIGDAEPDLEDIDELRRMLYGLHAILRLHTVQEEESYLSLGEEVPTLEA